jgi:hypothetical protein
MTDFSVFDDLAMPLPPSKSVPVSTVVSRSLFIYELKDVIKEHALTLDQAIYLLATIENIDWELTGADALALVSKGLIRDNQVNQTLLFRTRPPVQGVLDLNTESIPRGTDETLKLAHNLETKLVPSHHLTSEYRKVVADEYFKGDLSIARYFIIFRHLFPVRDIKSNANWNKHFGISYQGISLWDSHVRVAKRFWELYRKKDIGLVLAGLYYYVADSVDLESEKCYVTKPYKYLLAYEPWYETAKERLDAKKREQIETDAVKNDNELNKTQAL